MEKKKLIISVAGEVNSGKSRLILLLKKFLRENNFEVEFDGGVDYENENQFDKMVGKNLDQAIEHIKGTRKIILKENQLNESINHRKIEFGLGDSIENAIQELSRFKERGELVYGEFNGQRLYSDVDDLESAYKKITGQTKSEFDAQMKAENDLYRAEKQQHEDSIPELTEEWIKRGNAILDVEYREGWKRVVPICLRDLYRGMELEASLEIIRELNAGCDFGVAKDILDKQNHSGITFNLVCSMVKSFCDRGHEFSLYVN